MESLASPRSLEITKNNIPSTSEKIRVICRFRPVNDQEEREGGNKCTEFIDDQTVIVRQETKEKNSNYTRESEHTFKFHRVFQEFASQQEVFEHSAQHILTDLLNGFHGAVIAYGQTGAGKTFTMLGPSIEDARTNTQEFGGLIQTNKGVIPRMLDSLFDSINDAPLNVTYDVQVAYMEIYQEKISDLLRRNWNLDIGGTASDGLVIHGLSQYSVTNPREALQLLKTGNDNRITSSTNSNDESSRGHAIFLLTLRKQNRSTMTTQLSQLYMVDLAGSERSSKTRAEGQQLEEAKVINRSLLALGNVISSLAAASQSASPSKQPYIPYRDSKLTRLLQNCFGGNSKTTLLINASPHSFNYNETLNTLRFGSRASIITNRTRRNEQMSVAQLKLLLNREKSEKSKLLERLSVMEMQLNLTSALLRDSGVQVDDLLLSNIHNNNTATFTTTGMSLTPRSSLSKSSSFENINGQQSSSSSYNSRTAADALRSLKERSAKAENELERIRKYSVGELFSMLCPLTGELMNDPVIILDGFTYERKNIEQWLARNKRSPITNAVLGKSPVAMIPNLNLRRQIKHFFPTEESRIQLCLFDLLPNELILHIFRFLNAKALGRAVQVCSLWRDIEIAYRNELWELLVRNSGIPIKMIGDHSWKGLYQRSFSTKKKETKIQPTTVKLVSNK